MAAWEIPIRFIILPSQRDGAWECFHILDVLSSWPCTTCLPVGVRSKYILFSTVQSQLQSASFDAAHHSEIWPENLNIVSYLLVAEIHFTSNDQLFHEIFHVLFHEMFPSSFHGQGSWQCVKLFVGLQSLLFWRHEHCLQLHYKDSSDQYLAQDWYSIFAVTSPNSNHLILPKSRMIRFGLLTECVEHLSFL